MKMYKCKYCGKKSTDSYLIKNHRCPIWTMPDGNYPSDEFLFSANLGAMTEIIVNDLSCDNSSSSSTDSFSGGGGDSGGGGASSDY